MRTNYLPPKVMRAHLRAFSRVLGKLSKEMPTLWCPIEPSGLRLTLELGKFLKKGIQSEVSILPANFDSNRKKVTFVGGDPNKDIRGRRVLVMDYFVTQDNTLLSVVDAIRSYQPTGVCTYGLVVERRAAIIPNYWGLMVDVNDRVRLLHDLPVVRLANDPYITIRKLSKSDMKLPRIKCGLKSLDRITWADRYYDMVNSASDQATYLLVTNAEVVGYATCHLHRKDCLMLDEVVVSEKSKGRGYGAILMKWLDQTARAANCRSFVLWSVKEQIKFYRKFGFKIVPQERMRLDGENYQFMLKPFRMDESEFTCQWMA